MTMLIMPSTITLLPFSLKCPVYKSVHPLLYLFTYLRLLTLLYFILGDIKEFHDQFAICNVR